MTANRSTAVMQRRRVAPDVLDYFPTPPFATRALCEFLSRQGLVPSHHSCWEPACGELHMVRPLRESFRSVRASDAHRYPEIDHELIDFPLEGRATPGSVDWVITNPPFRLAEQFIETAMVTARVGVAMMVRSAFLEGEGRAGRLFGSCPPAYVLQFVERVVLLEHRLIRRGAVDPFHAKSGSKASSATAYCWLIWLAPYGPTDTRLRWIPPSCARLERPGDYPIYASAGDAT